MKFGYPKLTTRAGFQEREQLTSPLPLPTLHKVLILVIGLFALGCATGMAQDAIPQRIDVVIHEGKTVPIPGVERVILLNDSLCNVQVLPDKVEFSGRTAAPPWPSFGLKASVILFWSMSICPPANPNAPH